MTKVTSIRLPVSDREAIHKYAQTRGTTVSRLIREYIHEVLEQESNNEERSQ